MLILDFALKEYVENCPNIHTHLVTLFPVVVPCSNSMRNLPSARLTSQTATKSSSSLVLLCCGVLAEFRALTSSPEAELLNMIHNCRHCSFAVTLFELLMNNKCIQYAIQELPLSKNMIYWV